MVNNTVAFQSFNNRNVEKNIIISTGSTILKNPNVYNEAFELKESLCSESELRFGSCESSELKFKITNSLKKSLEGQIITVRTNLFENNSSVGFFIGKYKVVSDVLSDNRNYREIKAYDSMYDIINADVTDWYNGLTFPLTMK